jgi:hypothetical protein
MTTLLLFVLITVLAIVVVAVWSKLLASERRDRNTE